MSDRLDAMEARGRNPSSQGPGPDALSLPPPRGFDTHVPLPCRAQATTHPWAGDLNGRQPGQRHLSR